MSCEGEARVNILLRRRKLGRTSCREIQRKSVTGLRNVRNDLFQKKTRGQKVDWLFRWGCTSPCEAEHVVNKAESINLASEKYQTRVKLREAGLPIPDTWGEGEEVKEFPRHGIVIRPIYHHQGRNFILAKSPEELQANLRGRRGYYLSAFIPKTREFRVFVIQGRVAAIAEKFVKDQTQLAWNKYQGGSFQNLRWREWPLEICKPAIEAVKAIGLDFGGVDIISVPDPRKEGKIIPYILELNSAPSLTSPYRQGVFATCFDSIVKSGSKASIPVDYENGKGYGKFLHPALKQEGAAEA